MMTPDREAVDTFVSITGVSETVAYRKLQEHGCDLNEAVNAYYAELDANANNVPVSHVSATRENVVDVDQTIHLGTPAPLYPLGSAARHSDRFSLLDTNFPRGIFDSLAMWPNRDPEDSFFSRGIFDRRTPLYPSQEPFVSHPREVRQIPIEVKDSNRSSASPEFAPTIEDVTGIPHDHGPEVHGTVTISDDEYASDNDFPFRPALTDHHSEDVMPVIPEQNDSVIVVDDIEEQMIRAAIEASRREAEEMQSVKQFHSGIDLGGPGAPSGLALEDDEDLAYAAMLSLKTAELENENHDASKSSVVKELPKGSIERRLEPGGSFILADTEDVEEHPLVRNNTRGLSSGFQEHSKDVGEISKETGSHKLLEDNQKLKSYIAAKEASLPREPEPDNDSAVHFLVRMPDGSRCSRRFLRSDKLQVLFDFIDVSGLVMPGNYKLVTAYPRRTFSDAERALTLLELGLTNKQEVLYLESV